MTTSKQQQYGRDEEVVSMAAAGVGNTEAVEVREGAEIQADIERLEAKKADLEAKRAALETEVVQLEASRRKLLALNMEKERKSPGLQQQREMLMAKRLDLDDLVLLVEEVDKLLAARRQELVLADRIGSLRAFRAKEAEQEECFQTLRQARDTLDQAAAEFARAGDAFLRTAAPTNLLNAALRHIEPGVAFEDLEAGLHRVREDHEDTAKRNAAWLKAAVLPKYHRDRDLPLLSAKQPPTDLLDVLRGRLWAEMLRASQTAQEVLAGSGSRQRRGRMAGVATVQAEREDALSDIRKHPKQYHPVDLRKVGVGEKRKDRPPVSLNHHPGGTRAVPAGED